MHLHHRKSNGVRLALINPNYQCQVPTMLFKKARVYICMSKETL